MDEGPALLASICAKPAEDTPRLVYADWLQENGQEARAEFIRVQVKLALLDIDEHAYTFWRGQLGTGPKWVGELAQLRNCEMWLLGEAAKPGEIRPFAWEWFHEPYPWIFERGLRRGFIERIDCRAFEFLRHEEEFRKTQPITEVRFIEHGAELCFYNDQHPDFPRPPDVIRVGLSARPNAEHVFLKFAEFEALDNDIEIFRKMAETVWNKAFPGINFTILLRH